MATKRSSLPEGVFHVMGHAEPNGVLFRDDEDRDLYLSLLHEATGSVRWNLLTYALMGNHVHLLLRAAPSQLSDGMWFLHGEYARRFRRKYQPQRGHVFDGRYRSLCVTDEPYFAAVSRYIALNPVDARLCRSPEAYPWSAHASIVGRAPAKPCLDLEGLLWLWGRNVAEGARGYEAFVLGEDPPAHDQVLRNAGRRSRPPLDALLQEGDTEAMRVAHVRWGYSLRQIASAADIHHETVRRRIART